MYEKLKRLMDIFLSLFLLILFSPLLIFTAIAIKIDSKGPILAKMPKRVGKGGKLFYVVKFRSMIDNAYEVLHKDPKYKKFLKELEEGGNYKIKNDPRITKVGKFIRKHSIDEIPQLINVLKGEMSIVGPRPYYPEELVKQQKNFPGTEKYVKEMQTVRPGITGYWQVNGRSDVMFDQRIKMDAYYARKKSIVFDILILIKTPFVMISGKGAS